MNNTKRIVIGVADQQRFCSNNNSEALCGFGGAATILETHKAFLYHEEGYMLIDAVQLIKERLTMRDVLERYGFAVSRRMACPLHNGSDKNFEIKGNSWRCYSRCGSGDAISFVQQLYGLSFQDALRRIDSDFNLNIYGDHSFDELRKSHYHLQAIKAKREREKREKQKADDEYWAAFDEWKRLDDNRRLYRPNTPDEALHPLFVESLQKLDYQKYVLDCLDGRRTQ